MKANTNITTKKSTSIAKKATFAVASLFLAAGIAGGVDTFVYSADAQTHTADVAITATDTATAVATTPQVAEPMHPARIYGGSR